MNQTKPLVILMSIIYQILFYPDFLLYSFYCFSYCISFRSLRHPLCNSHSFLFSSQDNFFLPKSITTFFSSLQQTFLSFYILNTCIFFLCLSLFYAFIIYFHFSLCEFSFIPLYNWISFFYLTDISNVWIFTNVYFRIYICSEGYKTPSPFHKH